MEKQGKLLKSGLGSVLDLPQEMFLQIVLFSSKKSSLFWKQLCLAHHVKGDQEKRKKLEEYESLYEDGYKEMYLSNNIKRLSNYTMLFETSFPRREESVKEIRNFDKKYQCNVEQKMIEMFKDYQCGDFEGNSLEGTFIKDRFDVMDEDHPFYMSDNLLVEVYGVQSRDSGAEKGKFGSDPKYQLYYYLEFYYGDGEPSGYLFIGNSAKHYDAMLDDYSYGDDILWFCMRDFYSDDFTDILEEKKAKCLEKKIGENYTFGEVIEEELGRKGKYTLRDIQRIIVDGEYERRSDSDFEGKCNSFFVRDPSSKKKQ